jgi:hypothetical protein
MKSRVVASVSVFALALATRLFYIDDILTEARRQRPGSDFQAAIGGITQKYTFTYEDHARWILRGHGWLFSDQPTESLLTILHPPGYPIFIAGVYSVAPRKIRSISYAQIVLDSACAAGVTLASSGIFGLATATLAGTLIAISPHLAFNSIVPMPDSASAWPIVLAMFLLLGTERVSLARFGTAAGCIGLSCWLRANAMLLPLLLAVFAWRTAGRRAALVVVAVAYLTISPITVRNALQYHVFVPVGWGSGGTLVQGIADYDFENRFGFPRLDRDLAKWDDETVQNHLDRERILVGKGVSLILQHPLWFASVVVRRALFQWSYDTSFPEPLRTPFHTRIQEPVMPGTGLRSLVRLTQSRFNTPLGRILTILGIACLAYAGRRQELTVLMIVPTYYLVVQSVLHTEYRYSLVIHYFMFVLMAIGFVEVVRFGAGWLRRQRSARARDGHSG